MSGDSKSVKMPKPDVFKRFSRMSYQSPSEDVVNVFLVQREIHDANLNGYENEYVFPHTFSHIAPCCAPLQNYTIPP